VLPVHAPGAAASRAGPHLRGSRCPGRAPGSDWSFAGQRGPQDPRRLRRAVGRAHPDVRCAVHRVRRAEAAQGPQLRHLLGSASGHPAGGRGQLAALDKKRACALAQALSLTNACSASPPASASPGAASALRGTAGTGPATRRGCRRGITAGGGSTIGEREGDRVGHFLADLGTTLGPDYELEENTSFKLLDRVDHLGARAGGSSPFSVDTSGWWDFDLEIGIPDFALPSH